MTTWCHGRTYTRLPKSNKHADGHVASMLMFILTEYLHSIQIYIYIYTCVHLNCHALFAVQCPCCGTTMHKLTLWIANKHIYTYSQIHTHSGQKGTICEYFYGYNVLWCPAAGGTTGHRHYECYHLYQCARRTVVLTCAFAVAFLVHVDSMEQPREPHCMYMRRWYQSKCQSYADDNTVHLCVFHHRLDRNASIRSPCADTAWHARGKATYSHKHTNNVLRTL